MVNKQMVSPNTVPAENQVENWMYFLGNSNSHPLVMILGNSITLHNPREEIGWYGKWGMAASCADSDYVHQLYSLTASHYGCAQFCVLQMAEWECNFKNPYALEKYATAKGLSPDILIFRLGENISHTGLDSTRLYESIRCVLDFFSSLDTNVIMTTCFISNPEIDTILRQFAVEHRYPLVELNDLGLDPAMTAMGHFDHSGVACHPGDDGMRKIAERIWEKFPK